MENEYRINLLLQVFTLILVFKGISATYFATKYSMQNQLWLVDHYTKILTIIPIFLLIPLFLIALPILFKLKQRTKIILDYTSIIVIALSLIILFFI